MWARYALAAFFLTAGIAHFVATEFFVDVFSVFKKTFNRTGTIDRERTAAREAERS